MFSSRPPFNDDPMPYENRHGTRQNHPCTGGFCAECITDHKPRAWYDRPQHNPTNPILVEFRATAGRYFSFEQDLVWWTECLNDTSFDYRAEGYLWTPEQIDHARRVLTRLAHFTKEN